MTQIFTLLISSNKVINSITNKYLLQSDNKRLRKKTPFLKPQEMNNLSLNHTKNLT